MQAEAAGCELAMDTAEALERDGNAYVLRCAEESFRGRAVIVAAGSKLRSLGIPGEDDFEGRGVSHCASCDGAFFAGKTVAVAGGGDSALEEAAVLTDYVERVLVLHRGDAVTAQRSWSTRRSRRAASSWCRTARSRRSSAATTG